MDKLDSSASSDRLVFKGIPYRELQQRTQKGEYTGNFTSSSGRELKYIISQHHVFIQDPKDPYFMMEAMTDENGEAEFNLRTRKRISEGSNPRHPDMFGKEFIGFALDYFNNNGSPVKVCVGKWLETESDNFDQFMAEYSKDLDKVKAAKGTWSGKTFASFGYTELRPEDIQLKNASVESGVDETHVVARFRKPSN